MLLRKITCEAQCSLDVLGLGRFVSTGQQDNQLSPTLPEIHPITGAVVDPQLRDTLTNRLNISGISGGEPSDPCLDTRSPLEVAQVVEPLREECGFADFDYETAVAARLRVVNAIRGAPKCPTSKVRGARPEGGGRRYGACMTTIACKARWPGVPLSASLGWLLDCRPESMT